MAIEHESSTGAQGREEKKDHPRNDGRYRGTEHAPDSDVESKQAQRAKGKRIDHSDGGGGHGKASGEQPNVSQDNTKPGGNRPKNAQHNQGRLDHN
jgi:hypothetical protein